MGQTKEKGQVDMDIKEFRKLGYRFVDWVADYLEDVRDLPVMAQVKPGEIRSKLPQEPLPPLWPS